MTKSASLQMTAIAVLLLSDLYRGDAFAQGAPGAVRLEEVTVTARKREESLLDVPVSVTAFTSERLQELDLQDLTDIARLTPGLSFEQTAFNAGFRYLPQIRFRGMSTNAPQGNSQVGAVFQDGVYIFGGAQSITTEDTERVEVLKGPQNTYFGRNTFAGAINYISRTPSDEFSGEVRAKLEERETYNVSASLEGPIVGERVAGRLIVGKWQDGAHYQSLDGGDIGRQATQFVTVALQFTPVDDLKIKVRGHYQEDADYGNANFALRVGSEYSNCRPNTGPTGLNAYCGAVPSVGDTVSLRTGGSAVVSSAGIQQDTRLQTAALIAAGRPTALADFLSNATGIMNDIPYYGDLPRLDHFGSERTITRLTANWSYDFDGGSSLAGNVGYGEMRIAALIDNDQAFGILPSAPAPLFVYVPLQSDDLSAEVRFVSPQDRRFRWLLGANMFELKFDGGNKLMNALTGLALPGAFQNSERDRSEVAAVFGAISYDLLPTLTADLEVRYQSDKLKAFQQTAPNTFAPIFRTFKDVLPRAILSWHPKPETNLYLSWSRGALPGIANAVFQNLIDRTAANPMNPVGSTDPEVIRTQLSGLLGVDVPLTLDSEQADQFELGWKQQFLDGRLFTSVAAYHIEWANQKQAASASLSGARLPNGNVVPVLGDITGDGAADTVTARIPGASRIYGVEFDASYRPVDSLTLTAGGEWVKSRYDGFFPGGAVVLNYSGVSDLDGKTLFAYPTTTFFATGRWEQPLTAGWRGYMQATASYTGKIYTDEGNLGYIDPYTLVNAAIGGRSDNLSVELYGSNLTDYDGWINGRRNQGSAAPAAIAQTLAMVPTRKRVFGIRATMRF